MIRERIDAMTVGRLVNASGVRFPLDVTVNGMRIVGRLARELDPGDVVTWFGLGQPWRETWQGQHVADNELPPIASPDEQSGII